MTDIHNLSSPQPVERNGPFLIAGLGNPGRDYENNRHNVGFMLVNRLSASLKQPFNKVQSRALVAATIYHEKRLLIVKPQTYMNASGSAIGSLVRFYKVSFDSLLVAYDDVDLPLGILRMRPSGGSAGQKGMQSIIERLGTEEFPRLRLGTGRPPGSMDAADYVLQDFSTDVSELLNETLDRAIQAVLTFVDFGLERSMNSFNG